MTLLLFTACFIYFSFFFRYLRFYICIVFGVCVCVCIRYPTWRRVRCSAVILHSLRRCCSLSISTLTVSSVNTSSSGGRWWVPSQQNHCTAVKKAKAYTPSQNYNTIIIEIFILFKLTVIIIIIIMRHFIPWSVQILDSDWL